MPAASHGCQIYINTSDDDEREKIAKRKDKKRRTNEGRLVITILKRNFGSSVSNASTFPVTTS
jgi:hypothetical protein